MNILSIDFILLFLGFSFTFFIPGFLIVESFFKEIPIFSKVPLYLFISILVSSYAVYVISLGIGFSRFSIFLTISLFLAWLIFFVRKRGIKFRLYVDSLKEHWTAFLTALIIFILFLIALYPAVFSKYQNYFVMSAVNWQDTAMHQSIIQSISQGNFPPQAPYFSGRPLNYYYFADFHTSILQTLSKSFFPRILIYDNPFFVLMFFLSIYALSYEFFKSRLAGILGGITAIFSGNFLYIKFFQDFADSFKDKSNFWTVLKDILSNHSYTMDYGKLMQMTPVSDYFLQNRPMMIGLPAVILLLLLLKNGFDNKDNKYFILVGLLTASLLKFQLFAFGISVFIFILSWLFFSKQKKTLRDLLSFSIPLILFMILYSFFFKSNSYIVETFLNNFRFGVWDKTKDLYWYLSFPFANFGIPFLLSLFFLIFVIFKKIQINKQLIYLFILSAILFAIPFIVFFTIYDGDMLKFFYFALIFLSLLSGFLLAKLWHKFRFGFFLVVILIAVSSFNGFITLGWSFFNKYMAYSESDYDVGLWIRDNTPKKSIFITMPTVHSPVSDIGGRLRVLSYTTWPYSHGFNKGEDNIFLRLSNIESVYQNPENLENARRVLNLYKVNYIYLGPEEKNKYSFAREIFDQQIYLELVYNSSDIQIYKVL